MKKGSKTTIFYIKQDTVWRILRCNAHKFNVTNIMGIADWPRENLKYSLKKNNEGLIINDKNLLSLVSCHGRHKGAKSIDLYGKRICQKSAFKYWTWRGCPPPGACRPKRLPLASGGGHRRPLASAACTLPTQMPSSPSQSRPMSDTLGYTLSE